MSVLVVIPARYASSRYPGKPLVELTGANGVRKSLIERSWIAACRATSADRVVIATDDEMIREASEAFGAEVVMTPSACANGTERCAATIDVLGIRPEIVVNLQGDAPLTPAWFVDDLVNGLRDAPEFGMATPVLRCNGAALAGFRKDRAAGRVGGTTAVFSETNRALYFSKEVIPYTQKDYAPGEPTPVFHHVGVYAYRPEALDAYRSWPTGQAENLEGLEQLRFLENNTPVLCVEVEGRGREFWELNNPEDVPKLEAILKELGEE